MNRDELIAAIKPKVTEEFMETFIELASIYGWQGDFSEIADFSYWIHNEVLNTKPVCIDPYE